MEHEQKEQSLTAIQICNKIDQEKLTPISSWRFTLRNSGFWSLWGLSIFIGSCATAASIFSFLHSGWQYRAVTHDTFLRFFFDVMPLFWIVSLGAMIVFGYFNIRHTTRGYRFSFYLVVFASVVASFIGGTILYAIGVAGDIDDLRRPLPFSSPMRLIEEERWNDDARGLASGTVTSFDREAGQLVITNSKGEEKIIFTSELGPIGIDHLEVGAFIRVIGLPDIGNNQVFVACVVLPWDMPQPRRESPFMVKENLIERNTIEERTSICKDVRPYQMYKETLITN